MSVDRRQLLPFAIIIAPICLVAGGVSVYVTLSVWLDRDTPESRPNGAGFSALSKLPARDRIPASIDIMDPETTVQQRFATYDKIVVEVKKDGTLRVLGEQMQIDAFRSLLAEQRSDNLRTLVTIRPDDDCLYGHIGRVIAVCDDVGIPHQMVSVSTATAPPLIPDKRA